MNCSKSFLLLACILFSSSISFSSEEPEAFYFNNLNRCKITEEMSNDYEPEKFQPTNNLLRKPGQVALFCGEKILVHGKVLDEDCTPVSDAKVYVWQVDCGGRYPYQTLKNSIDEDLIDLNNDTTFTGSGVATTNNNGEFYFLTIYPARAHSMPPHINVRVEHRRLGELQTSVVLKNHKVKNPMSKPELAALAAEASDAGIYDFKIVMPGESIRDY